MRRKTRKEFEQFVADALTSIPRRFRDAMQNIAIVVEDEPSPDVLHDMEIEPPDTLLGLYQGTPLTERRWDYGNALPDRILIFQGPHEREADGEDDLVTAIGETLIHEVGHYFGMSEEQIEEIEERYWRGEASLIRARKRFGQNFLEPAWVAKVIAAIDPKPDEAFLEIGPGPGALTRPLAERTRAVVAIEIDRELAADLTASAPSNVTVIAGDFLETSDFRLLTSDFRVVGNLPYNVASPILIRLRDLAARGLEILDATVMLQREVADRLTAVPGTRDYGVLTVLVGHTARAERLLALPPGAFRPAPKVHSALVRLTFHPPEPPVRDAAVLERLVRSVFTQRRKTLANGLRPLLPDPGELLRTTGLDGRRRPETLTIAEFARLADAMP